MVNLVNGKVHVPQWLILIIFCLIFVIIFGTLYYNVDEKNVKLVGLFGGIVTGLIVFILTFVTLIQPLQNLDRYEKMGIKNILTNRHDKDYYAQIVGKAEKTVRVMGASCSRFVDDFLDMQNEDKILVDSLYKHLGLKVQLLIPEQHYMADEAKSRLTALEKKIQKLTDTFGERVQLRRFRDKARHSFVIADEDLIAGPVFEGDMSKHGPAVHVAMSTRFAQKYDEHFNAVWNL